LDLEDVHHIKPLSIEIIILLLCPLSDISKLNNKFGMVDDLKALSKVLHDWKMLLMVDILINHSVSSAIHVPCSCCLTAPVPSLTQHPTDFSSYFFKDSVHVETTVPKEAY
jgi:hypothetical protein